MFAFDSRRGINCVSEQLQVAEAWTRPSQNKGPHVHGPRRLCRVARAVLRRRVGEHRREGGARARRAVSDRPSRRVDRPSEGSAEDSSGGPGLAFGAQRFAGQQACAAARLGRGAGGAVFHRPAGLGRFRLAGPVGGLCRASGAAPAGHPARGVGQRSRPDAQQRRGLSLALLPSRAQCRVVAAQPFRIHLRRRGYRRQAGGCRLDHHAAPPARGSERGDLESRRQCRGGMGPRAPGRRRRRSNSARAMPLRSCSTSPGGRSSTNCR